jgi:hypothetical protein
MLRFTELGCSSGPAPKAAELKRLQGVAFTSSTHTNGPEERSPIAANALVRLFTLRQWC